MNKDTDREIERKRAEVEKLINKNKKLLLRNYIVIIVDWGIALIFLWLYFNPIDPVFKLLWGGCSGIIIFMATGLMMTAIKSFKITKRSEKTLENYLNDSLIS